MKKYGTKFYLYDIFGFIFKFKYISFSDAQANNKGTSSSKKKKQAKLQRAMKSIKKKQRASSESTTSTYSPLNHLNDPQVSLLQCAIY